MIIITEYDLSYNEDLKFFTESRDVSYFPCCGGSLRYRDTCMRIWLREGHERRTVVIRRLKCPECGTLHRELPDFLAPYKHYETELISGILDEVAGAEDMEGDLSCESTIQSWRHWLMANALRIDGYLKAEGSCLPGFTEELLMTGSSLLKQLRNSCQKWMEIILRFIYNSGGFLVSAWAGGCAPTSA